MNRILKKIRTGILAAGFISVSALAMAQNVLSVPGLGTIPLPHDMQLVDGKGSSVEKMFIENTQRPDFGESSQAAFMEIVAIPPGMDLFAEKGTHPPVSAADEEAAGTVYGGCICCVRQWERAVPGFPGACILG